MNNKLRINIPTDPEAFATASLPDVPDEDMPKAAPKLSLRQAVNAKCYSCVYDAKAPGTWRKQAEACSIRACPLWPLRPRCTPKKGSALSIDLPPAPKKPASDSVE